MFENGSFFPVPLPWGVAFPNSRQPLANFFKAQEWGACFRQARLAKKPTSCLGKPDRSELLRWQREELSVLGQGLPGEDFRLPAQGELCRSEHVRHAA